MDGYGIVEGDKLREYIKKIGDRCYYVGQSINIFKRVNSVGTAHRARDYFKKHLVSYWVLCWEVEHEILGNAEKVMKEYLQPDSDRELYDRNFKRGEIWEPNAPDWSADFIINSEDPYNTIYASHFAGDRESDICGVYAFVANREHLTIMEKREELERMEAMARVPCDKFAPPVGSI